MVTTKTKATTSVTKKNTSKTTTAKETVVKKQCDLSVLHVSPEFSPLAKIGGLADVAGTLPLAELALGVDARAMLPAWSGVKEKVEKLGKLDKKPLGTLYIALNARVCEITVLKATLKGLTIYLLDNEEFFGNKAVYPTENNARTVEPFVLMSYAAFELPKVTGFEPQILHVHDWPSAFIPCALQYHKHYWKLRDKYKVVFTIHNMAHQGLFDPNCLPEWGFDWSSFAWGKDETLEYWGLVNLMKGALNYSDAITTVSPSYRQEIATSQYGYGLEGVINKNAHKVFGILNGIDYSVWGSSTDKTIPASFNTRSFKGKEKCKQAICEQFGFADPTLPLAVYIGRLVDQKGVGLLAEALKQTNGVMNTLIIGSGNDYYQGLISDYVDNTPYAQKFFGFNEELAHVAYAGADMLLMPSLFEPCGLSQIIACSYATLPLVRATGGLRDTVIDAREKNGNGFVFYNVCANELADTIRRAAETYKDKATWKKLMLNAKNADFSWKVSATQYTDLYKNLLK